jgi:hypothetical protein
LIVAFGILHLLPDGTCELFTWTIKPRISAKMLGRTYIGGAYFFLRAAASRGWHNVNVRGDSVPGDIACI